MRDILGPLHYGGAAFFASAAPFLTWKTPGAIYLAPVILLSRRTDLGGHIFAENSPGRFPPQDPARVVVHPFRGPGHFFLCYLVKVCPFRKPAAQDPVHVFIAPALLRGIRVAIIYFCSRPF